MATKENVTKPTMIRGLTNTNKEKLKYLAFENNTTIADIIDTLIQLHEDKHGEVPTITKGVGRRK